MDETLKDARAVAEDLMAFLDQSPTPYHAVAEAVRRLTAAGYRAYDERSLWQAEPGTRGYVVRGGGSIIAWELGLEPPEEAGFVLLGAHTDSPNLRLKPQPDFATQGFAQLSIETYGGVLQNTWLDRDLSLAGRVVLPGGKAELVRLSGPLLRVPNLAIHLNREVNSQGLQLNAEKHLLPVLGLELEPDGPRILALVAQALSGASAGASPVDFAGFDLCLFDTQGAVIGGANGEFIFSARLDNLASCHAALRALLGAGPPARTSRVIALYDHEEVGSQSAIGARSLFLHTVLERLTLGFAGASAQALTRAIARSFLISADMAHAVHPNYADKHDRQHRPELGKGPVVKVNVNQSYATDGPAQGAFTDACRAEGVAYQFFSARNDMPCGSTIGPISAARLGLRTIDVGNPMLSMHSCREMASSADPAAMTRVLCRLLREPPNLDPAV
jgi:aspartyl aminopeptidase